MNEFSNVGLFKVSVDINLISHGVHTLLFKTVGSCPECEGVVSQGDVSSTDEDFISKVALEVKYFK